MPTSEENAARIGDLHTRTAVLEANMGNMGETLDELKSQQKTGFLDIAKEIKAERIAREAERAAKDSDDRALALATLESSSKLKMAVVTKVAAAVMALLTIISVAVGGTYALTSNSEAAPKVEGEAPVAPTPAVVP